MTKKKTARELAEMIAAQSSLDGVHLDIRTGSAGRRLLSVDHPPIAWFKRKPQWIRLSTRSAQCTIWTQAGLEGLATHPNFEVV
jgi:hypothetical protein